MQDTQEDMPNLGSRHLTKVAEELVDQIRKILHSSWSAKNQKYLKDLQKIAVAIQKTIDDRGDLKEVIPVAAQSMEQLIGKMGVKMNNLQAPEMIPGQNATPQDFQQTPPPMPSQPQMPPQAPMPAQNQSAPQMT
jgi:hypothetical protein